MPEDRLRFRCYRCQQLLGASSKKIGTAVSCPRCGAELVVPAAEPPTVQVQSVPPAPAARKTPASPAPQKSERPSLPSFMEEIAAAIPDDLASLRPEDIRVEAEFIDMIVTASDRPSSSSETPIVAEDASRPPPYPETSPEPSPGTTGDDLASYVPLVVPPPAASDDADSILPAISIEPPTIRPESAGGHPVREVVLPASVVLAWSLLVLLALPAAFIAGLLIGHFFWKAS